MVRQFAIVIFIDPEQLKNVSVSSALMGWLMQDDLQPSTVLINYLLCFHTWQYVQYSEKFQEPEGIGSERSEVTARMHCPPLLFT